MMPANKAYRSKIGALLICLGALMGLSACEEGVQVNLGIDRPFTMWGVLNPEIPVNGVRVFEILPTIQVLQRENIDAEVEVKNLTTGTSEIWRDSVVTLQDGDFRHVFWSDTPIEYKHTYEITTRKSDGQQVRANVTVPDSVQLEILEEDLDQIREIFVPIEIIGDPPALTKILVTYNVSGRDVFTQSEIETEIGLVYTGEEVPSARGYQVPIELRRDFRRIINHLQEQEIILQIAILREMEIEVHVGNEEWVTPNGVFDPEILVEPGQLSNVENGFGFVGAGFVNELTWRPEDILITRAGFQ